MNTKNASRLAAGMLVAAAVLPGTAVAKGGGGGGGGGSVTPPPSSAPCATLTPKKPTLKVNRTAAIDLEYTLASCSGSSETVATGFTQLSTPLAGAVVPPCLGPSWTEAPITLAPGAKTTFTTRVPESGCPFGGSGRRITVDATTLDVATSAVLARATSSVTVTLENF